MRRVVLASASPRRRELLAAVLEEFEVLPADVPEPLGGDPRENAVALACEKARLVARARPGAVVIGSDTIVHDGTEPYGKPASAGDAVRMLRALRGRPHAVVTGVCVVAGEREWSGWSESKVTLAALSDDAIAAYVASGRPLDKAGAYAIQDEDVPTVEAIAGCYCSVMGLPLWLVARLLKEAGVVTKDPGAALSRCRACPERPSGA